MSYVIRDKIGTLLMEIPNSLAQAIIVRHKGFFRDRVTKKGAKQVCFELSEDCIFTASAGFAVYFWKGSVLIPKH